MVAKFQNMLPIALKALTEDRGTGAAGAAGPREGCDATCDSASCAPKGFLKRTLTIEVSSFVLEF